MIKRSSSVDPRWPPGRRRIELGTLLLCLLLGCPATAICPSRCVCNDRLLEAHCRHSNLEVVPIQLNPDVRKLSLNHNRIANIHVTFGFYISLTDLDLSNNRVRDLGAKNFEFQAELVQLNLSYNVISVLHKDAFRGLKKLTILDLRGNILEEISDPLAFRDLQKLRVLDLSSNNLESIAVGVFDNLIDLRRLLLRDNQILFVPEYSTSTARHLEELDLDLNLIQDVNLSRGFGNLQILRLQSNLISSLNNESLEHAPLLRILDLSDNNFTTVPTLELSKLANLQIFNLSCNLFDYLGPHAFQNLYKLTEIYLDKVRTLRKIDSLVFIDNPNIEIVSLTGNRWLRYLPKHLFAHKPRLRHVYVSGNAFSTLDASDLPLDQLETLRLGDNPFRCNCSLLWLWILKERQSQGNCSENCHEVHSEKQTADENFEDIDSGDYGPQFQGLKLNSRFHPVILDLDDVTCEGLERGKVPLRDVPKNAFDCTVAWVLILSIAVLIVLSIFLIVITTYIIRLRVKKRSRNPVENFLNATKTYEDTHQTYYRYNADKTNADGYSDAYRVKCMNNMYMSPVVDPFASLRQPTFHPNISSSRHFVSEANIYQEPFAPPQRPHIVYV